METSNEFLVGIQGLGNIVIMKPIPRFLTREQAIRLAVYLVAMADEKAGKEDSTFSKVLTAVLET